MKTWEETIAVQKKKLIIMPSKGFANSVMINFKFPFGWIGKCMDG